MMPHENTPIEPSNSPRRPQILVVDDDPLFRSLIVGVLRRDFDVTVASDGTDGFYHALDQQPDVTVLDLQMPGWDGLKTLRQFRSHPMLAEMKVMVLTSDSSRETVLAAIHAGADDYTIKTAFSRDEFRQKLERLCRKSIPVDTVVSSAVSNFESDFEDRRQHSYGGEAKKEACLFAWSGTSDALQDVIDSWE